MKKFSSDYIAVGVSSYEDGLGQGVVIHIGSMGHCILNENLARKLADDILRNANYLWPVNEEARENT